MTRPPAGPRIAVIIPTLDEAALLAASIGSARRALGGGAEIIVVDGGSHDGTPAVAAGAGARVITAPAGRGVQLRAGAAATAADVVVLLHADTLLPPGAGAAIDTALADPAVVGGAFRIRFHAERGRLPLAVRALAPVLNARTRWLGMATGDQAIFARAATLRALGGVPAVPLFEDVRLYAALRRAGRVRLLPCAVSTSPRRFVGNGPLRTIGWHVALRTLHALGVAPPRLAGWYRRGARRPRAGQAVSADS